MRLIRRKHKDWEAKVALVSAQTGFGIDDLINHLKEFNNVMTKNNCIVEKRTRQSIYWMWAHFQKLTIDSLHMNSVLRAKTLELKSDLQVGKTSSRVAAISLYNAFESTMKDSSNSNNNIK